ncbi:AarF/ABC1/UbiB kinase family protein [Candidatus Dojkabacteria bacterium]|nr:AarF/ABC1/UbiB kinase family protein [Candidatus Dojkabacteria bacterium]
MKIDRFITILAALTEIAYKGRGLNAMSKKNKEAFGKYLRKKLENLGPAFIKFGQMLSVRFDLLPSEVCMELQGLLDDGEPFDDEVAKERIEREVGIPIKQLFQKFHEKPIAAASIGQVYKAMLKNGDVVAIKVRRPGVTSKIKKDISIFKKVVRLAKVFEAVRYYRIPEILEEFEKWTVKELDYMVELGNMEKFRFKYKDNLDFRIPRPYREYSTSRVLVMEFINGVSLDEIMQNKKNDDEGIVKVKGRTFNTRELIQKCFKVMVIQNFEGGLFHGDPHPANVIVDNDDRICLIDFGIVGNLNKFIQDKIRDIVNAVNSGEIQKIVDVVLTIDEKIGNEKVKILRQELSDFILKYSGSSIGDIGFTQFMVKLLYIGSKNGIEWPVDVVLFSKQFVTMDGIALKLAPDLDPFTEIAPFFQKKSIEEFADRFSDSNLVRAMYKYAEVASKFPTVAAKLLDSAEKILEKSSEEGFDLSSYKKEPSGISQNILIIMLTGFLLILVLFGVFALSFSGVLDVVSLRYIWVLAIIVTIVFSILILKRANYG